MVDSQERTGAERVSIAGSGRIGGGTYHSVKVAGSGTIDGDVTAQTISIAGSCTIEGSATAEELKTAGSSRVTGDVHAEEFRTTGSSTVEGNVTADVLKSSGSQRVGGKVTAGYVKTGGSLKVGGDVEADKFVSEGSFKIDGLLSADEISIRLGGECRAQEIGGERVEVRARSTQGFDPEELSERMERKTKGKRWKFRELGIDIDIDFEQLTHELGKLGAKLGDLGVSLTGFGGHGTLQAETIEGDDIYLESTRAKTVRGKRVTIGPECEIERVEYEESLDVHDSSDVTQTEKI